MKLSVLVEVQVEIFVGDGGLQLLPGMPLPPELDPWCRIVSKLTYVSTERP